MKPPIINYNEFLALPKESIILIEAGADFQAYKTEHLNNAGYIDLDEDLASYPKDPAIGGRHPLPKLNRFINKLTKLGISIDSHVIIYDRNYGANAAARFWWMLTALGIPNVQVLNGGFQFAKKQGFPTTDKINKTIPNKKDFPNNWLLPTMKIEDVKHLISEGNGTILDVRDPERYGGISEPIDPVAGHIPTAENIFFKENLTPEGLFKSPKEIQLLYQDIMNNKEKIVVHCGSGVTACHTLLSLVYAGFEIPYLYIGSWSEWCRNEIKS